MINKAIALFRQAEAAGAEGEDAEDKGKSKGKGRAQNKEGDISTVTPADILGATALAFVEKARVAFIMGDDDDEDDDDDSADGASGGSKDTAGAKEDPEAIVVASLTKASEYHGRCVSGIGATDEKCDKQLAFSRALLEFANSDFDEQNRAMQLRPLDMAVAASEAAMHLQPNDRPSKAQFGACLMCKADVLRDTGDDKVSCPESIRGSVTEMRCIVILCVFVKN
eukprot:m.662633 g.662633  ORF g.662633 m.662633 type:complete len:225 (+) comp22742_c1_seq7:945-1619(+)